MTVTSTSIKKTSERGQGESRYCAFSTSNDKIIVENISAPKEFWKNLEPCDSF